jgi:cell wall-associated NlpC family hydrolase
MELEKFLQKYIGEPYDSKDCWDIVKAFHKEVLGKEISVDDYGEVEDGKEYREKISRVVEIEKCNFQEIETPSFGDVILFNIFGLAAHIGVYIGNSMFLHSMKENGCVIESLPRWSKRVKGYYRWPE